MSAGEAAARASALARPTHDLALLAPRFRLAVSAAIDECNDATNHLEAVVYETFRSPELQAIYFARGRTVKPPPGPVTNAMSNLFSWHGYGLAVDVIHRTRHWGMGEPWFSQMAEIFKRHGCTWGGDWTTPDLPHVQWGLCKASPSQAARELMRTRGVEAVWEAVGALDPLHDPNIV